MIAYIAILETPPVCSIFRFSKLKSIAVHAAAVFLSPERYRSGYVWQQLHVFHQNQLTTELQATKIDLQITGRFCTLVASLAIRLTMILSLALTDPKNEKQRHKKYEHNVQLFCLHLKSVRHQNSYEVMSNNRKFRRFDDSFEWYRGGLLLVWRHQVWFWPIRATSATEGDLWIDYLSRRRFKNKKNHKTGSGGDRE